MLYIGLVLEISRIEVSAASDSIQLSVLQTSRQGMKCELQLWPLLEQWSRDLTLPILIKRGTATVHHQQSSSATGSM